MPDVIKTSPTGSRIGIDLGGTKTEIIVLSAHGDIKMRKRVATPQHSYTGIVQNIAALVAHAQAETGPVAHVGIGMPGAPDRRTGLIKNANTTCLIGQPFARDLEQALGIPVKLENDANCFALSEATDGSAAGHDVVFGVILGTGVGAGWCFHGRVHPGLHHIGGEWGHNPIPLRLPAKQGGGSTNRMTPLTALRSENWETPFVGLGRLCYCGKTDCIETHLCGAGLSKTHAELQSHALQTSDTPPPCAPLWSVQEIVHASEQGDSLCRHTLALYARQLACALATVINMMDPDIVVLGGGLSNLDAIYPLVQQALPEFVFNNEVLTPVVKAAHGDSSGVRGAAWL